MLRGRGRRTRRPDPRRASSREPCTTLRRVAERPCSSTRAAPSPSSSPASTTLPAPGIWRSTSNGEGSTVLTLTDHGAGGPAPRHAKTRPCGPPRRWVSAIEQDLHRATACSALSRCSLISRARRRRSRSPGSWPTPSSRATSRNASAARTNPLLRLAAECRTPSPAPGHPRPPFRSQTPAQGVFTRRAAYSDGVTSARAAFSTTVDAALPLTDCVDLVFVSAMS